jgi:transcriptional regulator
MKVMLTKLQAKCLDLYKQGLCQWQIAEIIYGSKERQGSISKILRQTGKKIGMDKIKALTKDKYKQGMVPYEI